MSAVLTTTKYGPMLVPPNDTYIGQALIRLGEYSPREIATWRPYLPVTGVVIDGGANVGAHTIAFARACPAGRVIAVEPQRMLAYMLAGTVALNRLAYVEVRNEALGDVASTVRMPALDYGAVNNFGSLPITHGIAPRETDYVVPISRIDDWALPRLDFLKLDIEGAERLALDGALETIRRCRPVIAVEANLDLHGLLNWLQREAYTVWFHHPPYGRLWEGEESANYLALPTERGLPAPEGDIEGLV